MSELEYCAIWTSYRKMMLIVDEPYLLFEHWSSNLDNKPVPLDEVLNSKIAQLGLDNWEMVEYRETVVNYGGNTSDRHYIYLLFERSTGRETVTKWEYCRVHHVKVSETFNSGKVKCVIEYFKPNNTNVVQDAPSQNVHSVAATLALVGWEVVKWQPPTIEYKLADKSGDIVMKRAVS